MEQIILIVHVVGALAITGLIMLQQGKGADMGASFGGGSSQTLFGSSGGGSVLTAATAWLVTLFFATSFGLAVIAKNKAITAGDIDIPTVIETSIAAPVAPVNDIPATVETELQSSNSDIPAVDVPPVSDGSDIPQ